jgi:hypothetical protein
MSETFKVLFQRGFFKILDEAERKKLANFCTMHKGKMGLVKVSAGFSMSVNEKGEVVIMTEKVWSK